VETNSVEVAPEPVSTNVVSGELPHVVLTNFTWDSSTVFTNTVTAYKNGTNASDSYYSADPNFLVDPVTGMRTASVTYVEKTLSLDPAPPSHVRKIIKRDQDAIGEPK
jgi:hypothetical protein